mgnify:CR=1 FL=1
MERDRLTKRFLLRSPDALTDAELLELLLRFTGDGAGERAEAVLARFPNIAAVMEADTEALSTVSGLSENDVLLLRLVPELHRRYFLSRTQTEERLTDSAAFGRYLLPYFYGARDEMVYLLSLDAAGKVLNCRLLGHGSVNSANVPARRLVQEALGTNATAVVLAHNHPSGIALPSKEDVELTLRLRDALDVMDILLLDHIVVADDDFVSMRDSGYLFRY